MEKLLLKNKEEMKQRQKKFVSNKLTLKNWLK